MSALIAYSLKHKLSLLLFIPAAGAFLQCGANAPVFKSRLGASLTDFPCDGVGGGQVVLYKPFYDDDSFLPVEESRRGFIEILKKETASGAFTHTETIYFKSTLKPGTVNIKTRKGLSLQLNFYRAGDSDNDGFPDIAEFNTEAGRNSFIDWFVRIAESQLVKPNYSWNKDQRDCSGLIRYAYKEAMKNHDARWQKKHGIVLDKNLPDVREFNYPDVPVISQNIFKVTGAPADDMGSFSAYADAEHLMKYNVRFIGKDAAQARRGDILFFYDEKNADSPYHSMIISRTRPDIIIIYHTGSEKGMKRVKIGYLNSFEKFTPQSWNPNFMGVFRFHIID